MPHVTLPVDRILGPLIDISVRVTSARADALKAAQKPVPPAVHLRALVDTGASCCVLDPSVIDQLELSPTGQSSVHTPSTGENAHQCFTYDVYLSLIHPELKRNFQSIPVMQLELKAQGIDALIGRDVLSECLMVYDGSEETFSLAF